jgi:hypothetical protein
MTPQDDIDELRLCKTALQIFDIIGLNPVDTTPTERAEINALIHDRELRAKEEGTQTPCGYCGKPVEAVVTVTPKLYCNHSHRQLAYKKRIALHTGKDGKEGAK